MRVPRKRDPWAFARAAALAAGAKPPFPHLLDGTRPLRAAGTDAVAPRKRAGGPSKTEERYRLEVLEPARALGEVLSYTHQPPPFELAHRCTFTADFLVDYADGTREAVDVKGAHVWEDATIKLKFLARLHPELRCVQVHRITGGGWRRRVIPPFVLSASSLPGACK